MFWVFLIITTIDERILYPEWMNDIDATEWYNVLYDNIMLQQNSLRFKLDRKKKKKEIGREREGTKTTNQD